LFYQATVKNGAIVYDVVVVIVIIVVVVVAVVCIVMVLPGSSWRWRQQ